MANPFRWCLVSQDCVLQVNVVLVVVGLIILLDVFSHLYLKTVMFPGLRVYPVSLRTWLFWVRFMTMVSYVLNACLGIRMARHPNIFMFAGYMLVGCVVLLYTFSIAVTRFMYPRRFKFYVQMLVNQMWIKDTLGKVEVEFGCCGRTSAADYLKGSTNRTWASGSCCGEHNCPGCTSKLTDYLWTVEMDVARDNIIVSLFLFVALAIVAVHYSRVKFQEDSYDSDDSEETSSMPPAT
ncbi:uncharacterized protein LOC108029992 [Drosophila biarmipes]|uniref:uncharacterized protein LOC108029992 n=1 Tax=Drosophila biarmipes TaxID=125945 RepID=UPI0007E65948|nr:uncharacterized protein LOC108029992 [Drosophila biarmipes]